MKETGWTGTNLSTFHYGSIKILPIGNTLPQPILSTFHYGSIKIMITIDGPKILH